MKLFCITCNNCCRHGDMLYLAEMKTLSKSSVGAPSGPGVKVQEDEVDRRLAAMDGRVHRKKDPQL